MKRDSDELIDLLVRDEDLERGDEVRHGDGLVALPLLIKLRILNEDEEIVGLALVVDLELLSLATNHFD